MAQRYKFSIESKSFPLDISGEPGLHNIILEKYLDIPLCLPPYQEQQRIINKIEEIFGVLDLIMENL